MTGGGARRRRNPTTWSAAALSKNTPAESVASRPTAPALRATHAHSELDYLADRVLGMERGRLQPAVTD